MKFTILQTTSYTKLSLLFTLLLNNSCLSNKGVSELSEINLTEINLTEIKENKLVDVLKKKITTFNHNKLKTNKAEDSIRKKIQQIKAKYKQAKKINLTYDDLPKTVKSRIQLKDLEIPRYGISSDNQFYYYIKIKSKDNQGNKSYEYVKFLIHLDLENTDSDS